MVQTFSEKPLRNSGKFYADSNSVINFCNGSLLSAFSVVFNFYRFCTNSSSTSSFFKVFSRFAIEKCNFSFQHLWDRSIFHPKPIFFPFQREMALIQRSSVQKLAEHSLFPPKLKLQSPENSSLTSIAKTDYRFGISVKFAAYCR